MRYFFVAVTAILCFGLVLFGPQAAAGAAEGFEPQPDVPKNIYYASMLPWESFEGFNLNLQKGWGFLLPTFTFGKYTEHEGRITLPLAIQVHHAACDGFHACRLAREVQALLDAPEAWRGQ